MTASPIADWHIPAKYPDYIAGLNHGISCHWHRQSNWKSYSSGVPAVVSVEFDLQTVFAWQGFADAIQAELYIDLVVQAAVAVCPDLAESVRSVVHVESQVAVADAH